MWFGFSPSLSSTIFSGLNGLFKFFLLYLRPAFFLSSLKPLMMFDCTILRSILIIFTSSTTWICGTWLYCSSCLFLSSALSGIASRVSLYRRLSLFFNLSVASCLSSILSSRCDYLCECVYGVWGDTAGSYGLNESSLLCEPLARAFPYAFEWRKSCCASNASLAPPNIGDGRGDLANAPMRSRALYEPWSASGNFSCSYWSFWLNLCDDDY